MREKGTSLCIGSTSDISNLPGVVSTILYIFLLEEFKVKKTNIAVVVDEWGGTAGIVTLEDVVEEVMGELRDPFDNEEYEVIKQKDGGIIVEGAIKIYDLEENLDLKFPDEREYDTLAGFILDFIGDIPQKGQELAYKGYSFKVIKIHSNRIYKVEIKSINEPTI